jgi:hypothetical protein
MYLAAWLLTSWASLLLVLVVLDAKILPFKNWMWKPNTFALRKLKLKHFSQEELRPTTL